MQQIKILRFGVLMRLLSRERSALGLMPENLTRRECEILSETLADIL